MRRRIFVCAVLAAGAILVAGCAKSVSSSSNEQLQKYYNSWITVKKDAHPDYLWWPVCYGTKETGKDYGYIIQDFPGDGDEIIDSVFLFVEYTSYDLDGTVQTTTDKEISHRTGVSYDPTYYYGPVTLENQPYGSTLGFYDGINGILDGEDCYDKMRIGGRRTLIIPGWLTSSYRYSEDINYYLKNVSGTDCIYDITVTGQTDDITQYQIDSIETYCYRHYRLRDSTYTGFYYKCLSSPKTTFAYDDDTTIYINYIGRLLNGQVFDTNIADTAKVWNLYSTSETYTPMELNWSSDSSAVTLGSDGNSVITGFGSIVKRMNDKEIAVGVFYSDLGYGSSGSGSAIPGYSPLEFEIRIVDAE